MNKFRIELKWGLIFVGTLLAWMVMERLLGLHAERIEHHAWFSFLFVIPAVAIYVFALRDKRRNFHGGTMTFVQGLVTGLGITVVVAALSPLIQLLVTRVISPEFFSNMIGHAVGTGRMTLAEAEANFNLPSYMIQGVIGALVMGVVTSAVVAFFLRSRN